MVDLFKNTGKISGLQAEDRQITDARKYPLTWQMFFDTPSDLQQRSAQKQEPPN